MDTVLLTIRQDRHERVDMAKVSHVRAEPLNASRIFRIACQRGGVHGIIQKKQAPWVGTHGAHRLLTMSDYLQMSDPEPDTTNSGAVDSVPRMPATLIP